MLFKADMSFQTWPGVGLLRMSLRPQADKQAFHLAVFDTIHVNIRSWYLMAAVFHLFMMADLGGRLSEKESR
jgi:hypothetical protein